jgi:hypothetical protein
MTTIDPYSLTTIPVQQLANGTEMRSATAFVWKHGPQHYLVTNWHVISGRDARTGDLMTDARPDTLRCLFNVRVGTFGKQQWDIKVRDDDGNPLWLVHPGKGRGVDVVLVPLPMTGDEPVMDMYPINVLPKSNIANRVGMDVFVLGYPFGNTPPGFPVWKRGSVASEPDLVNFTTGYQLIDTASRPGMSGGPVVRRTWCTHLYDDGSFSMDGKSETRFIGIYSGRLYTKNQSDVQLGIVWPAGVIEELIAGNHRDAD